MFNLMLNFKKHIIFIFLLSLLTPTLVKASHDFFAEHEHEHIACTSKTEQHLHDLENKCTDFHLQFHVFYFDFDANYELYSFINYVKKTVAIIQQLNSVFSSHKSSRAPPSL